jgi:tellurite resistance-related uncharacterized protein
MHQPVFSGDPATHLHFSSLEFWSKAGMPDGLFSNQKSQFGQSLEGLVMENILCLFGLFYGHWKYFMAIW